MVIAHAIHLKKAVIIPRGRNSPVSQPNTPDQPVFAGVLNANRPYIAARCGSKHRDSATKVDQGSCDTAGLKQLHCIVNGKTFGDATKVNCYALLKRHTLALFIQHNVLIGHTLQNCINVFLGWQYLACVAVEPPKLDQRLNGDIKRPRA